MTLKDAADMLSIFHEAETSELKKIREEKARFRDPEPLDMVLLTQVIRSIVPDLPGLELESTEKGYGDEGGDDLVRWITYMDCWWVKLRVSTTQTRQEIKDLFELLIEKHLLFDGYAGVDFPCPTKRPDVMEVTLTVGRFPHDWRKGR